jgi:DNA-binding XRE family transcriptional regulator
MRPGTTTTLPGNPVRVRRQALGMSQAELAVAAGLGAHTIYLAEKYGPSQRVAASLAGALYCTPSDLLPKDPP